MSYILDRFDVGPADRFSMPSNVTATKSTSGIGRWVARLSWVNLIALLFISWLLFAVSENWWLSSALTYAPRTPYLIPALGLLLAACLWHRSSISVNLISIAMVAVPIMGFSLPVGASSPDAASDSGTLKVISCNVQDFRPDFASVLAEISRFNPDLVAFQDARSESTLLKKFFDSWHVIRDGEYFLASKYPVKMISVGHFEPFDRDAVMQCEVELPSARIMVFNVHQMTPRHGLRGLDISSPITHRGSERLSRYLELRAAETADVRDFIEGSRGEHPTLVMGDFNMPCESSLYHRNWFGFQNAFNTAGTGYGYSFPCTRQYCWPAGMPWMRLDHILTDDAWQINRCFVGQANGSDHRLIAAILQLK